MNTVYTIGALTMLVGFGGMISHNFVVQSQSSPCHGVVFNALRYTYTLILTVRRGVKFTSRICRGDSIRNDCLCESSF